MSDNTIGFKHLFSNGETIYTEPQQTDFTIWLLRDAQWLEVHVLYQGEKLAVKGLTLVQNNAIQRIWLAVVLTGCLVGGGICLWRA